MPMTSTKLGTSCFLDAAGFLAGWTMSIFFLIFAPLYNINLNNQYETYNSFSGHYGRIIRPH